VVCLREHSISSRHVSGDMICGPIWEQYPHQLTYHALPMMNDDTDRCCRQKVVQVRTRHMDTTSPSRLPLLHHLYIALKIHTETTYAWHGDRAEARMLTEKKTPMRERRARYRPFPSSFYGRHDGEGLKEESQLREVLMTAMGGHRPGRAK
jgi:hypothetical protein